MPFEGFVLIVKANIGLRRNGLTIAFLKLLGLSVRII